VLAGAAAATALAAGCGSSANHEFGTVTDCASVGRVTQVDDPAGDQRGGRGGAPKAPQGDLTGLRISRGGGRLCAEFRTKADIKPYAAFLLVLRPKTADTPAVQVEATVLAGQPPQALVNPGGRGQAFRKVRATVGIDGKRLTLVVGRTELSDLGAGPIFDAFRFQARSAVAAADDARYTDCLPNCN